MMSNALSPFSTDANEVVSAMVLDLGDEAQALSKTAEAKASIDVICDCIKFPTQSNYVAAVSNCGVMSQLKIEKAAFVGRPRYF